MFQIAKRAKQNKTSKKEFSLTASGYEYDKELVKLSVKVFPALQALIANQHELLEVAKEHAPERMVFLEAHLAELVEVEETIAQEYAKQLAKREEAKKKRLERKQAVLPVPGLSEDEPAGMPDEYNERFKDGEALLDELAGRLSPGLPSAKLERTPPLEKGPEIDVRRIALGAAIKALGAILQRELEEGELSVVESQVDAYL